MKKIIYSVVLLFSIAASAQEKDILSISVKDAVRIGLDNRNDLKADKYNAFIAERELGQTKKNLLPDIFINNDIIYNNNLQPTFVPAGLLGNDKPEKVTLGAKNNTSININFDYTLYKPGNYTNIKIARNRLQWSNEKNRQAKLGIKEDIIKAYYEMILKKNQYQLIREEEARYLSYYNLIKAKYDHGVVIENELMQAKVDYFNAEISTKKSEQDYNLSCSNLKYKINLPDNIPILYTDSIETLNSESSLLMTNIDASEKTELKQLELDKENHLLQLRKTKENNLPSISLTAYCSKDFQSNKFNYSNNANWYPTSYVGIKISLPISQIIKNKEMVRQERLKKMQTEENIKQCRLDIDHELETSLTEVNNALLNMEKTKANYLLAEEIFNTQKKQYALGDFQYIDLLSSEKSINTAKQNYISAIYDFLIAKLKYEKVIEEL